MDAGMLSKILYIDLSRRRHWAKERPELFEESLGGAGVGIRLLSEECPSGADPLVQRTQSYLL
jgi:aldehyde:ferredoxin oxidoreductase